MNQIQGCRKKLRLQCKKEHDLHRRESRKIGGKLTGEMGIQKQGQR